MSKTKSFMTARLIPFGGGYGVVVKIPVLITTIPEVPEVVLFNSRGYRLKGTTPLTYEYVLTGRAEPMEKTSEKPTKKGKK